MNSRLLFNVIILLCGAAGLYATEFSDSPRWECLIRGQPKFSDCGALVEVNRHVVDSSIPHTGRLIPLSVGTVNLVTIRSRDCHVPVDILLDFPDPHGPPVLVQHQGAHVTLELDHEHAQAIVSYDPLPLRVQVRVLCRTPGVRYALRDSYTGESHKVFPSLPVNVEYLRTGHTYDVALSRPWYPTLRRSLDIGFTDTMVAWDWKPLNKVGLVARSLVPGWGHAYAQRQGWWWPAATGIVLLASGGLFWGSEHWEKESRAFDQRSLTGASDEERYIYGNRAQNALNSSLSLHSAGRVALVAAGAIWVVSISDAIFFWVDPWGLLTGIDSDASSGARIRVGF